MNTMIKVSTAVAAVIGAVMVLEPGVSAAKAINFGGYSWTVRSGGYGSPGVAYWSESNAFVDANGKLHLKMTYVGGKWYGAEIVSTTRLGFGTYQYSIDSRVDKLDKNVVLGLFMYPTPDVGKDRTNEIDIEFARWGAATNKPLNYTVWPVLASLGPSGVSFPMTLNGDWSTHRYTWRSQSVRFQSTHGHYDTNPYPIADWTFRPTDWKNRISQSPMPVHINLWAFAAPSNGQQVEIIISAFKYTP